MFGVTGAGLSTVRYYSNNKKAPRRTLDAWDRQSQPTSNHSTWAHPLIIRALVMDRDFRLTGIWREQTDNPVAPVGFEVNNPWRVCRSLLRSGPSLKLYRWRKGSFEPLQNSYATVHISWSVWGVSTSIRKIKFALRCLILLQRVAGLSSIIGRPLVILFQKATLVLP